MAISINDIQPVHRGRLSALREFVAGYSPFRRPAGKPAGLSGGNISAGADIRFKPVAAAGGYEARIRAAADEMVADALSEPAVFRSLAADSGAENRRFFDKAIEGEAQELSALISRDSTGSDDAAIRLGGTALLMIAARNAGFTA